MESNLLRGIYHINDLNTRSAANLFKRWVELPDSQINVMENICIIVVLAVAAGVKTLDNIRTVADSLSSGDEAFLVKICMLS